MKYKISEVKRILNISEDTLRYFDNKKIIKSVRDKNNNYRYFKSEDINKIFAYKMYRSLLFNMNDADLLISGKPIDMLEEKLSDQLEVIHKEQEYLIRATEHIKQLNIKINKWREFEGGFEITESPNCYYHCNQTASCFISKEEVFESTHECLNYLPDIWPCFNYDNIRRQPGVEFSFGYGFYTDEPAPIQGLLHLPPAKCLYTIFILESNLSEHLPELLHKAEVFCMEHGYKLKETMHGSILHEMKEADHTKRLFDVYIPFD
jgi:DNA-binding transcriptional MerR regulator